MNSRTKLISYLSRKERMMELKGTELKEIRCRGKKGLMEKYHMARPLLLLLSPVMLPQAG